jgi:hypothetical protein
MTPFLGFTGGDDPLPRARAAPLSRLGLDAMLVHISTCPGIKLCLRQPHCILLLPP